MKTLQNNFTTPEQSKRLLELGVPADSADCYFNEWQHENIRGADDLNDGFFLRHPECFPCWSVGRLIEIYDLFGVCTTLQYCENYLEELVREFESLVKNNGFDFSKLEE